MAEAQGGDLEGEDAGIGQGTGKRIMERIRLMFPFKERYLNLRVENDKGQTVFSALEE